MQKISLRSTLLPLVIFAVCNALLIGCTAQALSTRPTRAPDPAEMLKDGRMALLLGSWKLIHIAPDGHAPANPGEDRTLLFANGVVYADLWEHRLTYDYRFVDDTHLQLTWTASTNSNDKVGAVITYPFVITGTELTLGSDVYQHVVKPIVKAATPKIKPTRSIISPTATLTEMMGTESYHNPNATREPGVITATLGQSFTLGVGQSAQLDEMPVRIKFLSVPEDSRCPTRVSCVWTGAASVEVRVTFATDLAETVMFDTNPAPQSNKMRIETGGLEIELVVLNPYPIYPTPAIEPSAYRAVFVVRAK